GRTATGTVAVFQRGAPITNSTSIALYGTPARGTADKGSGARDLSTRRSLDDARRLGRGFRDALRHHAGSDQCGERRRDCARPDRSGKQGADAEVAGAGGDHATTKARRYGAVHAENGDSTGAGHYKVSRRAERVQSGA